MVDVVQLVERQIVVLVVVGSSPIVHPICYLRVSITLSLKVKAVADLNISPAHGLIDPDIFSKEI